MDVNFGGQDTNSAENRCQIDANSAQKSVRTSARKFGGNLCENHAKIRVKIGAKIGVKIDAKFCVCPPLLRHFLINFSRPYQ